MIVGTCLLVILATVVTGCLLLFAGDGKAPSGTGGLPTISGPQGMMNAQTAPGLQDGSLQGQALLDQQTAATGQQSPSNSQNQQSAPSGGTVTGTWLLDVQGTIYDFPALSVTLKKDGTVSLQGDSTSYIHITNSHYSFKSSTRAIEINCDCEITVPQTGTMPVALKLKGTFDSGLTQATGTFTAESNSTPTDQGTFRLYR